MNEEDYEQRRDMTRASVKRRSYAARRGDGRFDGWDDSDKAEEEEQNGEEGDEEDDDDDDDDDAPIATPTSIAHSQFTSPRLLQQQQQQQQRQMLKQQQRSEQPVAAAYHAQAISPREPAALLYPRQLSGSSDSRLYTRPSPSSPSSLGLHASSSGGRHSPGPLPAPPSLSLSLAPCSLSLTSAHRPLQPISLPSPRSSQQQGLTATSAGPRSSQSMKMLQAAQGAVDASVAAPARSAAAAAASAASGAAAAAAAAAAGAAVSQGMPGSAAPSPAGTPWQQQQQQQQAGKLAAMRGGSRSFSGAGPVAGMGAVPSPRGAAVGARGAAARQIPLTRSTSQQEQARRFPATAGSAYADGGLMPAGSAYADGGLMPLVAGAAGLVGDEQSAGSGGMASSRVRRSTTVSGEVAGQGQGRAMMTAGMVRQTAGDGSRRMVAVTGQEGRRASGDVPPLLQWSASEGHVPNARSGAVVGRGRGRGRGGGGAAGRGMGMAVSASVPAGTVGRSEATAGQGGMAAGGPVKRTLSGRGTGAPSMQLPGAKAAAVMMTRTLSGGSHVPSYVPVTAAAASSPAAPSAPTADATSGTPLLHSASLQVGLPGKGEREASARERPGREREMAARGALEVSGRGAGSAARQSQEGAVRAEGSQPAVKGTAAAGAAKGRAAGGAAKGMAAAGAAKGMAAAGAAKGMAVAAMAVAVAVVRRDQPVKWMSKQPRNERRWQAEGWWTFTRAAVLMWGPVMCDPVTWGPVMWNQVVLSVQRTRARA